MMEYPKFKFLKQESWLADNLCERKYRSLLAMKLVASEPVFGKGGKVASVDNVVRRV